MALGNNQKHFQLSDLVTGSNHPYVVDLYTCYGGMTCQAMFKSTEEILWCYQSNELSWAEHLHGAIPFFEFYKKNLELLWINSKHC